MADFNVTASNYTGDELAAANDRLAMVNADRAAQEPPLTPFANALEMFEWYCEKTLESIVQRYQEKLLENDEAVTRWRLSTPAQRSAALSAMAPLP